MPLPPQHMQERLSDVYIRAVIARAGFQFITPEGAEYGVDGYIQEVQRLNEGSYEPTGYMIQIQAKSTIKSELREEHVVYDMEVPDYNKLATKQGPTPRILILFCLPRDQETWLHIDEERLLLKRCCYWTQITGPASRNQDSQRILIPRTQMFSPSAVTDLFKKVRQGAL